LEKYAFNLEDAGFKMWSDFKHMSKDELKDKGQMPDGDANICHAVLSASAERPDLLRQFQIPEFKDIMSLFVARFPEAAPSKARRFAVEITDELGVSEFSWYQIQAYLKKMKSAKEAIEGIENGLPNLEKAEAARQRPEPPPPKETPTCWIYVWLKSKGLEMHADAFMRQDLQAREDVLDAPLDHKALQEMGITKIGSRCKILRCIEEEKSKKTDV